MDWFLKVLNQYADFNGRARRKEYWMFALFYLIFGVIATVFDNVFGITIGSMGYGPIYLLLSLALFIPGLAVGVRRLHDTNKSGWIILVGLIPVIGAIWLIVYFAIDGDPGSNEYGVNPKEVE